MAEPQQSIFATDMELKEAFEFYKLWQKFSSYVSAFVHRRQMTFHVWHDVIVNWLPSSSAAASNGFKEFTKQPKIKSLLQDDNKVFDELRQDCLDFGQSFRREAP